MTLTNLANEESRIAEPTWDLRFTGDESDRAHEDWGANCGPHSLAAALGKTLEEVRAHIDNFKGWMSPTMIERALLSMGCYVPPKRGLRTKELCNGINRIQWEGKWLNPGVPARVAYFHTHWVAHFDGWVLCTMVNPSELHHFCGWRECIEEQEKMHWHVTHYYGLSRPSLLSFDGHEGRKE